MRELSRQHTNQEALRKRRITRTVLVCLFIGAATDRELSAQSLPEAPSALLGYTLSADDGADTDAQAQVSAQTAAAQAASKTPPPCSDVKRRFALYPQGKSSESTARYPAGTRCVGEYPLQPIVSTSYSPLTPEQKGVLAVRDLEDPFNLITVVGYSGIVIAANAHSAYGPGFKGWGRLTGYSFLEDAQFGFFDTFAIPSLVHEDPRYHRMPGKPIPRRLLHAVAHTFISRHDDGGTMPNYATLATYPISAELSNLYVPGNAVSGPSTVRRISLGIMTDPVGSVVAEFLPDVAKRVQIHVIFIQQILQRVAEGSPSTTF